MGAGHPYPAGEETGLQEEGKCEVNSVNNFVTEDFNFKVFVHNKVITSHVVSFLLFLDKSCNKAKH